METKGNLKLLRLSLQLGGIITMCIGLAHIFMPEFGYSEDISSSMNLNTREHFYYLGTYAIAGFLLTLGGLSVYFSRTENTKNSAVVGLFLAVLWILRAILEFLYPVELPIFLLDAPHLALLPVITFLALSYSIGVVKGYKHLLAEERNGDEKKH